ncbi:DUF5010 domain-containing protein [Paenibacillus rhizovicinus]|uniref:DUF5010 domain-containing protein n=1 Tax=Paenibacillus rhizovicinus TaxID=2704463 RepID=A0A6C0P2G7_9BACL|nr:DUF5010 domain-containing protein [Paenibacillus rhizovicinus]QHW32750.1 DUF5010 domain-containing protein [Paenibacillus rhizovicinus]
MRMPKRTPKRMLFAALAVLLALPLFLQTPGKANASTPVIGETIALKALSNNNYVSADNAGNDPLIANRTSAGVWEQYVIRDAGGGLYALQANANDKYVSRQTTSNYLVANATTIGANEKFQIIDAGGSNIYIKSNSNGLYADADIAPTLPMIANRTSAGPWETFEKVVISSPQLQGPHYLGVTFGFSDTTLHGGSYVNQGNSIFNLPLFKATADEAKFWDNYVEELVTSGVDFVAPTIRGFLDPAMSANSGGDTRKLSGLVDAINRRGAAGQLKISALDDTPASMTDKKNAFKHGTGGYNPPFDIGDATGAGEGGYQYIWDHNLRAFFQAVPDSMRFKIDGRPVIYEWGIGDFAFTNQGNGNLKKMVDYIRQRAQAEFGINPYLIVDQSWLTEDPTVASVVDGVDGWFPVPGGKSVTAFNGHNFGVTVPSFRFVAGTTSMIIDPNHGQTFKDNLNATVPGSLVTLVEGFSDWEENTAMWRGRDGAYAQTQYDYPNQMINILRKYSQNPFPAARRIEAESADLYNDTTTGSAFGGIYRDGSIDVENTGDTGGGWDVGSIAAGEWLEWKEIPLQGTVTMKVRIATPNSGKRLRFVIDGTAGATVTLPNTGGWQTYQTVNAGTFTFPSGSYHTVRIEMIDGDFNLNYWSN